MTLLQARPRQRQNPGVHQREIPLKKKIYKLLPDHIHTGNTFYPYFLRNKRTNIWKAIYIYFSGLGMRRESELECFGMGNLMVEGAGLSWSCFFGQQQCTTGFRETPPTSKPNAIHTVHPNSCLAGTTAPERLQPQSTLPSVTLPTQYQTPAPVRQNINTTLQLLGGWRSIEVSPHRKQDWFVLNVRKFFPAV